MNNTPWITNAILDDAAAIANDIDTSRVLNSMHMAKGYSSYENDPQPLQQFITDTFTTYRTQCTDTDTANYLDTLQQQNKEPSAAIALLISIEALAEIPDYKSMFPIYAEPKKKIYLLLQGNTVLTVARDERPEPAQAAADPNGTDTAATGSPEAAGTPGTENTATGTAATPVYVAIPAAYTVTGKKAPGDYMEQLERLGYSFRLNKMTDHIEVNGKQLSDRLFSEIVLKMKENNFNSERMTEHCINVIATENEYNPIIDYFNSLSWDGTEVLDQFILMMNPADPVFAGIVFRKWMIGAVAKIMEHAQNQMLVLVGKQGSGKSYFSRWLCPEPMQEKYFVEDPINPDDKDFKIAACNKWLWEVKELQSTTRRADVEALKGFLTTKNFTYRPPHGRYDMTRPVTASYIGTLNDDESGFLTDVTGNRRFWIIEIGDIDHTYTTIYDVNDLWAEAFARWKRGDDYNLTADEFNLLSTKQENYKAVNNTAEAMKQYFEIDPAQTSWIMPINEVREILARRSTLSATDLQNRKMGAAAAELKLGKAFTRVNGNKTPSKCYVGIREITNIPTP